MSSHDTHFAKCGTIKCSQRLAFEIKFRTAEQAKTSEISNVPQSKRQSGKELRRKLIYGCFSVECVIFLWKMPNAAGNQKNNRTNTLGEKRKQANSER